VTHERRQNGEEGGNLTGGSYSVPPSSAVDSDAARAALAGDEFVFDVQGHFLDYSTEPGTAQGREFWSAFPQRDCGEADPRVCFSVDHFMEEVFLRSDTSMAALSALPIAPEGSPMSAAAMDRARRLTEAACHDQRMLLHALALPNVGDLQANLDAMSDAVAHHPVVCWKVFTNFPDLYDSSGNAWRLDDGDPSLARVGEAFLRHAVELGVPTVAAHKGLSTTLGYSSPFASPVHIGPAARAHPDVRFLVYHSGFEADGVEEQFGFPALSDEITRKILGLNALKLHDVDPITVPCTFTRADLEQLRLAIPASAQRRGPRNEHELRAFVARERAEHQV
jgi:hypothetical protein